MSTVDAICLANSRKLGGRCVAALRVDGKGWIRPTGSSAQGELDLDDCLLDDGSDAALFDVIRFHLGNPAPDHIQPENIEDGSKRWELVERPADPQYAEVIRRALVTGPELIRGKKDRVAEEAFRGMAATASLALIKPSIKGWHVGTSARGRPQLRCEFAFSGTIYDLVVTDPLREQAAFALGEGSYDTTDLCEAPADRILFTVSMGEPFNGDCYKLIAGVASVPKKWPHRRRVPRRQR